MEYTRMVLFCVPMTNHTDMLASVSEKGRDRMGHRDDVLLDVKQRKNV